LQSSTCGTEGALSRGGAARLGAVLLVSIWALACTAGSPSLAIGSDVPHTRKPFRNDPDDFQFAIVSDRTGGHRPGVFASAMEQVNRLQPEFVMCVGDLIEGYTEDRDRLTEEWREVDELIDRLDMPFFYTVGNHDIGNNVMRDLWRERNGSEYYAFVYKDVLFISLSTEDPPILLPPDIIARQARLERMMNEDPESVTRMLEERGMGAGPPALPGEVAISDAQVAYVDRVLREHQNVRWTLVFMHKPAWKYDSTQFERIEQLLADRPFTVVAGHEHYYDHSRRNGRDYIALGTTGGVWLSTGPGSFDHVTWVTLTDDGPVIANIRLDGLLDERGPRQ
jgi:hypothetical protein